MIDLFLRAHHYRTSRDSLTGIGAGAFGRDGFTMTPRSALFIPCQDSKSRAHAPAGHADAAVPRRRRPTPTAS